MFLILTQWFTLFPLWYIYLCDYILIHIQLRTMRPRPYHDWDRDLGFWNACENQIPRSRVTHKNQTHPLNEWENGLFTVNVISVELWILSNTDSYGFKWRIFTSHTGMQPIPLEVFGRQLVNNKHCRSK